MFDLVSFHILTKSMNFAAKMTIVLGLSLGFGLVILAMYPTILVPTLLVIFGLVACFGVLSLLCKLLSITISFKYEK